MSKYAEGTGVSVAQSRSEIEHTLNRYGATGFMYGQQSNRAMVAFEMKRRRYRMELCYPDEQSFLRTPKGATRTPAQAKTAYEQEIRRLWRGLAMIIKAKLEAVDAGVSTMEDELLSYTVMPNDETAGQWLKPQIEEVYRTGTMPPMLPQAHPWRRKQISGPNTYIDAEVSDVKE